MEIGHELPEMRRADGKSSIQKHRSDRCTGCKGIWLDALEKESLKKIEGSEQIDIGDPEVGRQFNRMERINCPHGHGPMTPLADPHQRHIWYENCDTCHGVFFDAGEFKDFKEETFVDFIKDLFAPRRKKP